jgi:hypothetical protein
LEIVDEALKPCEFRVYFVPSPAPDGCDSRANIYLFSKIIAGEMLERMGAPDAEAVIAIHNAAHEIQNLDLILRQCHGIPPGEFRTVSRTDFLQ